MGGGDQPDTRNMRALRLDKVSASGGVPDIIWDGVLARESTAAQMELCVSESTEVDFANVDLRGDAANISRDLTPHQCKLSSLPAVTWSGLASPASQ
jgi:hypothetical protein